MRTRHKEKIFYGGGVKCLNMLPREMLGVSSLRVFKFRLDKDLTNLLKLKMYLLIEGAGIGVL